MWNCASGAGTSPPRIGTGQEGLSRRGATCVIQGPEQTERLSYKKDGELNCHAKAFTSSVVTAFWPNATSGLIVLAFSNSTLTADKGPPGRAYSECTMLTSTAPCACWRSAVLREHVAMYPQVFPLYVNQHCCKFNQKNSHDASGLHWHALRSCVWHIHTHNHIPVVLLSRAYVWGGRRLQRVAADGRLHSASSCHQAWD